MGSVAVNDGRKGRTLQRGDLLHSLKSKMEACEQAPGVSVWDHCVKVEYLARNLYTYGFQVDYMKIPDWFFDYAVVTYAHPYAKIQPYPFYHDCGKPEVRAIDDQGRVRFPDHTATSKRLWLFCFPEETLIGDLIGWDMCLHTETAEEILAHEWPVDTAMTLLIVALAEVHANAEIFGGMESQSFKIKWKKIDRRGKMLCKHYFGELPLEKLKHGSNT